MADYKRIRDKTDRTAAAVADLMEAERRAREQKTARLRALRLAKEAVESAPKQGSRGHAKTPKKP
jgi:hypothetical protein